MSGRRKRGERRPTRGRLRLQERDLAAGRFVGRSGVVEIAPIALAIWGGTPGARAGATRRFRDLTDHGLIETHVRELAAPNRYTLTEKGASWMGRPEPSGWVFRTRVQAYSQSADHLVATAMVWAALARRLSRPLAPALRRFVTEGEIRRALGQTRGALIPDGIAVLATRTPFAFALEVDLSQERHEVLSKKLAKYGRHIERRAPLLGIPLRALFVVAPGLPRLARIAMMVREVGIDRATYFQDLARLTDLTVLDRVATVASLASFARTGADPFNQSLMEVCSCAGEHPFPRTVSTAGTGPST